MHISIGLKAIKASNHIKINVFSIFITDKIDFHSYSQNFTSLQNGKNMDASQVLEKKACHVICKKSENALHTVNYTNSYFNAARN